MTPHLRSPTNRYLQVLEAVHGLGARPSRQWLAACYSGLQVTAKPPQMTAATVLLTRLGWTPTSSSPSSSSSHLHNGSGGGGASPAPSSSQGQQQQQQPGGSKSPSPPSSGAQISNATKEELASLLSARQVSHLSASSSSSSTASANGGGAATLPSQQQPQQQRRRTPNPRRGGNGNGAQPRSPSPLDGAQWAGGAAARLGGPRAPRSGTPAAPNSALEGMLGLLRDAASSGMLPELKSTVFGQLEG